MTDRPETVPDLAQDGTGVPADEPGPDSAAVPGGNSEPVPTEVPKAVPEEPQNAVIAGNYPKPLTEDNDFTTSPNRTGSGALSDGGPKQAIDLTPSPVKEPAAPESSPEPADRQSSAREPAVASPDENLGMDYRVDPFGLFPSWLTGFEMKGKLHPASERENESVAQDQENAFADHGPNAQEPSTAVVSGPKRDTPEMAEPLRESDPEPLPAHSEAPATAPSQSPELITDPADTRFFAAAAAPTAPANNSSTVAGAPLVTENGKYADIATVRAPELAEPLPQQPKAADPVSRSTPNPAIANENNAIAHISDNARKGNEPKPAGTLASFVAIQGNDVLKDSPPQERREPQGYITVESKPESLRNSAARNRFPKPLEHRPKAEYDPMEPPDYPPKSQDYPSKRGDNPAKPGDESADLQRFASDFVRTDQAGSVADQHRFYADSVHFYGEGDLSWAGVAAATQRYHQEKRNRRFGAAAPAVVKGPVDGGFYVVDQPISWSQTDGSRLTRGRSILHLRVVPTGRGGWRITSIEEIGQ